MSVRIMQCCRCRTSSQQASLSERSVSQKPGDAAFSLARIGLKGLTTGCRDGTDGVRSSVHELEDGGYLCRSKVRDARGRIIDYNYEVLKGLTTGCRDGTDGVRSSVHELEDGGYLCRSKVRDARGRIIDYNYEVFELPQKERIEKRLAPVPNSPSSENPMSGFPMLENPTKG